MVNVLDLIRDVDLYKKIQVDELLFVEFKCPYDETKQGIWWHSNFFAYALKGEAKLKTILGEYLLRPGDCIFAKKGSVITWNQVPEEFCELLVFVPDEFIKTVIQKHRFDLNKKLSGVHPDTIIPLNVDEVLTSYFQSVLSFFLMPSGPAKSLLKLKFEELIVNISTTDRNVKLVSYFHELSGRSKPSIQDIMESNFTSHLSLKEFARMCSRSLTTFKEEFREIYQRSPGNWLREKRLDYASYLLRTTQMSIDEVCIDCGFENRSHFIRVFKSKFGVTPGRMCRQVSTL